MGTESHPAKGRMKFRESPVKLHSVTGAWGCPDGIYQAGLIVMWPDVGMEISRLSIVTPESVLIIETMHSICLLPVVCWFICCFVYHDLDTNW